eukprot:144557_1
MVFSFKCSRVGRPYQASLPSLLSDAHSNVAVAADAAFSCRPLYYPTRISFDDWIGSYGQCDGRSALCDDSMGVDDADMLQSRAKQLKIDSAKFAELAPAPRRTVVTSEASFESDLDGLSVCETKKYFCPPTPPQSSSNSLEISTIDDTNQLSILAQSPETLPRHRPKRNRSARDQLKPRVVIDLTKISPPSEDQSTESMPERPPTLKRKVRSESTAENSDSGKQSSAGNSVPNGVHILSVNSGSDSTSSPVNGNIKPANCISNGDTDITRHQRIRIPNGCAYMTRKRRARILARNHVVV